MVQLMVKTWSVVPWRGVKEQCSPGEELEGGMNEGRAGGMKVMAEDGGAGEILEVVGLWMWWMWWT